MLEFIYVGDPMCSWCWGFAPQIEKLRKKHADDWKFTLVLGGLRPGPQPPMDKEMKDMVQHHWEAVAERTGQPFDYDFFKRDGFIYDTEIPSRAIMAARVLERSLAFDFYHRVQEAFYAKNIDTGNVESYFPIVEEFGLNQEDFVELFESDRVKQFTLNQFELARKMQATGFPSSLAVIDGQYFMLNRGWAEAEALEGMVQSVMQASRN